jgi:hypothetical protein
MFDGLAAQSVRCEIPLPAFPSCDAKFVIVMLGHAPSSVLNGCCHSSSGGIKKYLTAVKVTSIFTLEITNTKVHTDGHDTQRTQKKAAGPRE